MTTGTTDRQDIAFRLLLAIFGIVLAGFAWFTVVWRG
jgi:hypothetical protein